MRRMCHSSVVALLLSIGLLVPGQALAHGNESGHADARVAEATGRLPHTRDFRQIGTTIYRYLPAQGEYEKRMLGKPPEFGHYHPPGEIAQEEEWHGSNNAPIGQRKPPCRTDSSSFKNRTAFVYAYSPAHAKTVPTANKAIEREIEEINWTFWHESSLASNGARQLQLVVDCDSAGNILVHDIETEATEAWEAEGAAYEIYSPAGGGYGTAVKYVEYNWNDATEGGYAFVRRDARKTTENANNGTSVAMAAGQEVGEGTGSHIYVALHELLHTMGATQGIENHGIPPAPYSSPSLHCYDGEDVMCPGHLSDPGVPHCQPWENDEEERAYRIDCGNDTYFNPVAVSNAPGSWLAAHWNIAEPENGFLVEAAQVTTEPAANVTGESAEFRGTVNPMGSEAKYYFEYGTSTSYGSVIPSASKSAGTGRKAVTVVEKPTTLKSNTTYHYRIVASSQQSTIYGEDKTFTTGSVTVPVVNTEAPSPVAGKSATLKANVNPSGGSTSVYFLYGPSPASYQATSKITLPAGTSSVTVSQPVSGLKAATKYSVRVVAESKAGKAEGTDQAFKTTVGLSLCKTSEEPCLAANRVQAATELKGALKSGSSFAIKTQEGTTLTSCTTSALGGSVSDPGVDGSDVAASISSATFSGCSSATTAEALAWQLEPNWNEAGEDSFTIRNFKLNVQTGLLGPCTFNGDVKFQLKAGSPSELVAESVSLPKIAGLCPSTVRLTASYVLSSPTSLFISRAALSTALCQANEEVCASANRRPAGTKVQAALKTGTSFTIATNEGTNIRQCQSAALAGEVTGAGAVGDAVGVDITSATFGSCSEMSPPTAEGLPWHAVIERGEGGSGTLLIPSLRLKVPDGLFGACTFNGRETLQLKGGAPSELTAQALSLPKSTGLCPSTVKLTATYLINSPSPLFVDWPS